jgi:HEPN domain-containing protein
MVDIEKHIAHWRRGAAEDWEVARDLVSGRGIRHGLFFAHLALEKTLKAHVCRATQELAPPIHNLVRLAETSGFCLAPDQRDLLAEVNSFNIEGLYPELHLPLPDQAEARIYIEAIEELLECLNSQF